MSAYSLQFDWAHGADPEDMASRPLKAASLDGAKLEAALMYALSEGTGSPPTAYRIVDAENAAVYEYPEPVPPDA